MKVYNVICPVCGFKKKSVDMVKRWDDVWVCPQDGEPRHPLDFVRQRVEDTSVPYTYPDVDGTSVDDSTWADTLTDVPTPPTDTL